MAEVAVIMSVYNGEQFLRESLESIINQTFKDIEIIIVDDYSNDQTVNILESYKDSRIRIVYNDSNLGLAKNLNTAIKLSDSKYVARMDADDVADIRRLQYQYDFLEKNNHIDICGTNVSIVDESGKLIGAKFYPVSDTDIKSTLLITNPIVHPTVMGKSEVFKSNLYDEDFKAAQDYYLWQELASKCYVFANIDEILLQYRVVKKGITSTFNFSKKKTFLEKIFAIPYTNILTDEEISSFVHILYDPSCLRYTRKELEKLIQKIISNDKRINSKLFSQNIWNIIIVKEKFNFKRIGIRNSACGVLFLLKKYTKFVHKLGFKNLIHVIKIKI